MEFESESDEEKLVPEERESNNEEESNESIEKEIDNNEESKDESETENDNEWNDIDWNEANNVQQQESNWNEIDWSEKNSGEQPESIWNDINWEDQEANREIESEEENEIAQEEYSGEFGNEYASVMSTVLISENEMYAYIQKYVEAMLEKQKEQITQEEQNQPNIIEDGPSELQQFLEQEKERIQLEQEQTELEATTSIEPEVNSITNEEEKEQELEKEVESQIDSSEEISPDNEGELNDQEEQEKLIETEFESAKSDEEVEQEEEKESITKEETNEFELEQTKNEELDHEEHVKHQELDVAQEMYMYETESETIHPEDVELEEESEFTSPHRKLNDAEIDDNEDSQEELEDILEHVREIEQKEEQELFEITKEQEIEQEKEDKWLKYLVNWVREESGENVSHQLKEEVSEISEKYGELDELTTRFLELYQKAQTEQLSQSEKVSLNSLVKELEKEDPSHIVLFTNLRAINRYLTHQKLKKTQLNHILKHLFTRFSPKKQLNRILIKAKNTDTKKRIMNQMSNKLNKFSKKEIEFFHKHGINIAKLKHKWDWLSEDLLVPFFLEVLYKKGNKVPTSKDLQNWGYNRFIIILREKYSLTLSDLVELAGKIPNINFKKRKSFSNEEKEFLIKNNITPENLTTRWEWVELFPDLITEFYKKVLYSKNNRIPTSRELKKLGYSQFMEKLRKNGISLSDLAKKCGFEPRSSHQRNISFEDLTDDELQFFHDYDIRVNELTSRWSWMDKNPRLVITFFEEVILPFFGYVPSWNEIANTEFSYYLQKLSKLDLSFPEVIKKANHTPNYQFLNDSQKRLIYKTTEFLANEYLEKGNSSNIPSLLNLAKLNYLNMSDVTFGKYAKEYLIKLYGDEYGNQLYSEMWFNKTLGISDELIHRINNIADEYCNKFIQSNKNKRPIPIKDVVEYVIPEISSHTFTKYAKELLVKKYGKNGDTLYAEMWPYDNLASKVGSRLHVLINDLLTIFFNKRGIQYISEPFIYPGSRPDGVLILNEELKLLLKKNKSLWEQIKVRYEDLNNLKAIVLDFTSDISDRNCTRKALKYQHSEVLLLIIGTSWYSKKPYKLVHALNQNLSNVHVIDIDFFTTIIDFSSDLTKKLQVFLNFAQNYNLDSLNSIKTLNRSNLHNTESLRKLLIKEGLIKRKIQEHLDLGLIDYPIKNKLALEDKITIKNEKIKNKIIVIDIETTGFNRDLDSIIEIGIVELDIKTGQIKILFNSQVKDTNFNVSQHIDNTFMKASGLDIYEISESIAIKECEEDLQLILNKYKCAAYNRAFDFGWLESRGFSIPMKLMDIMRFCKKSFPNCGSFKFQDVYRFIANKPNNVSTKYLTRSNHKSNHRAIDDAICEAELLYYLIKELGFLLFYQSKL